MFSKERKSCASLLVGLAMAAGSANAAQAVSIVNGSFEDASISPGLFTTLGTGSTALTGWTVGPVNIDYIGTYWQHSHGARSIDLVGNSVFGSISQTITGLVTGQEYKLSFDMAGNPAGGQNPKQLAAVAVGLASANYLFNTSGTSLAAMGWVTKYLTFTANAPTAVLTFSSYDQGDFFGAALDNVRISETPIPPALLLFGSALAGVGFLARRRKEKQAALA